MNYYLVLLQVLRYITEHLKPAVFITANTEDGTK